MLSGECLLELVERRVSHESWLAPTARVLAHPNLGQLIDILDREKLVQLEKAQARQLKKFHPLT